MAKISEIKNILKELDVKIKKKSKGTYPIEYRGYTYPLNENDIDLYISNKPKIRALCETSFSYPGHFEQVLEIQGRSFRLFRRDEEINLQSNDKNLKISVGKISVPFNLYLLENKLLPIEIKRIAGRSSFLVDRLKEKGNLNFNDILRNFYTVKVITSDDHKYLNNPSYLQNIAEAALFNIAYGSGVGITLSKSWQRTLYWSAVRKSELVQFPLRIYNSELVAYYNLALGSESLILAYLALYKILEYFFTTASEKSLHDKIKEKLIAPDFSHLKVKKVRELVGIVKKHEQKMDERKMLLTVLNEYFDKDDIKNWLEDYDRLNNKYFTNPIEIFGEEHKIDINPEQIFSSIGNRIYHIRNVLVHNKESEVSRFIPFSGQEEILYKETPLLLYIAEQLIIKTGRDIQF